jgi:uncharacterized membrane-anchored protein YitT (DUF2179 family)
VTMKLISLYVSEETIKKIKEKCKKLDSMTMSKWIRKQISMGLSKEGEKE